MTRFLFWNLHRADATAEPKRAAAILASLTRLVRDRGIDVLVFAEYEFDDAEMKAALDAAGVGEFVRIAPKGDRIVTWFRATGLAVADRYGGKERDWMTVRELQIPGVLPVWMVGVHLRDRSRLTTPEGRASAAVGVAAAIRTFEARNRSRRTVLVGDVNMNPYESGVVGHEGLHAMPTRDLSRSVAGLKARGGRPCFYNPMWAFFGDDTPGPPGTYFWKNAEESSNHFWHLYDQLLVRPELLDQFEKVEILSGDGVESYLTAASRPRGEAYSDHLPLFFEFDFTR